MKKVFVLGGFVMLLASLVACSGSSTDSQGDPSVGGDKDSGTGGEQDSGSTDDPPTWTHIYTTYFAPGTPGDCANSSCHGRPGGEGNLQFSNQSNCYQQMTTKIPENFDRVLIDLTDPSHSLLIDTAESPLSWFNPDGTMPEDNTGPNPTGKAEITAWINAGAPKN